MKNVSDETYLTAEEAAVRLNVSTDDLWTLTLESGKPAHIFHNGEMLYLKADVDNCRSRVVA